MSELAELRQLEQNLAEQLATLEALKGDAGLLQELNLRPRSAICSLNSARV